MTIEQILAAIAALQDAGVDEAIIKKMALQMLADDSGASVDIPGAADIDPELATPAGMGNQPQEGAGAAPITNQPMSARNPAPGARPATQQRPAAKPAAAARPTQPAPAAYNANGAKPTGNLATLAALIGTAFGAAGQKPSSATTATPPANPRQPAPAAKPTSNQPAPAAYSAMTPTQPAQKSQAEELLEDTIFRTNERAGVHTGQNSAFLRKLLSTNAALYAEAIGASTGLTADTEGGASPEGAPELPLSDTQGGEHAERTAFAKKVMAYRESELRAGRSCDYNTAYTHVMHQRGPSRTTR